MKIHEIKGQKLVKFGKNWVKIGQNWQKFDVFMQIHEI